MVTLFKINCSMHTCKSRLHNESRFKKKFICINYISKPTKAWKDDDKGNIIYFV